MEIKVFEEENVVYFGIRKAKIFSPEIRIATFQILLDDCVIGNSQLEMYAQFYQCNGIEPNVISLTKLPQFFFIQQRKFFTLGKSLISTCNNMAAISFFCSPIWLL